MKKLLDFVLVLAAMFIIWLVFFTPVGAVFRIALAQMIHGFCFGKIR